MERTGRIELPPLGWHPSARPSSHIRSKRPATKRPVWESNPPTPDGQSGSLPSSFTGQRAGRRTGIEPAVPGPQPDPFTSRVTSPSVRPSGIEPDSPVLQTGAITRLARDARALRGASSGSRNRAADASEARIREVRAAGVPPGRPRYEGGHPPWAASALDDCPCQVLRCHEYQESAGDPESGPGGVTPGPPQKVSRELSNIEARCAHATCGSGARTRTSITAFRAQRPSVGRTRNASGW
jgi:hypothetical protein